MPSKFVTAWKSVGGTVTPSIREIGAAYDSVVAIISAAGPAIGPLGLAFSQLYQAEVDHEAPLSLARPNPGNIFTATFLPSMVAACSQLTTLFLGTLTPPTPAQALAAWQATPMGALSTPSALLMAQAMSVYLSAAFIGGVGNPADPPPPPNLPSNVKPPVRDPSASVGFQYFTSTSPGYTDLSAHQVVFSSFVVPQDGLNYVWTFRDGTTVLGTSFVPKPKFLFPRADFFDVDMLVLNAAGSLADTRNIYSD